ncbi:MAG: Leucyl-tRNA synthetase [Candidatus Moranbacteria bacterium GW2011_GWF1_34_10]|nr:MAG: Leucyl-tRNA synthetase [Candidatus Moranbacteria bacterium GW2011_GWF1_34_10]
MKQYNHKKIEKKWQKYWEENGTYKDYGRDKKFYCLDMFPYPSGAGLHVGHPKGYIATDTFSRFKMLQGYSVIHPMGWDAFGLPAENYAIKNKSNPNVFTAKSVANYKKQLEMFGFTYDWDREINTTDPNFYKWTQWIFLKLFEKGLAYESNEPINWCPSCKTGLSNEDLEDGKCERCGSEVEQKPMRQWVLKMTDYADKLLYDLDSEELDWEDMIVEQQRNWIGRSEGAQFEMKISGTEEKIEVYTTRVDTVFGMTYAVVAPEHKIIEKIKDKIENYSEIEEYISRANKKTALERTELQKEKTGVEIKGVKVINPFNQEELPLFVADYVIGGYGTGAVMAVPAHDERDFEFAKKYNLPIKKVIEPCFDQLVEPGKIKENEPFIERDTVAAIVRHWEKDEYIVLKWKKVAWHTFITGGPEGEQSPEEGARMEILEETGYKNLKLLKELPMVHSRFYHVPKKVNRFAHFSVFYFQLENGEHLDISKDEKDNHEVLWIAKDKVEQILTADSHKYIWQTLEKEDEAYIEDGVLNNSSEYNFLTSGEARDKMTAWLEENKIGKRKVNYKMRDWVFSRQRYWGEPIPVVHCEKCGTVGIPEEQLPLELPNVENYEPTGTGESPLAAITDWVNTTCPKCGGPAKRETNTMPQWAGSSWYYLRYIDPKNDKTLIDKELEKEWLPVDLYVGGAEHATRHLLYARFWHKFLFDIGVVSTREPFKKLIHVGLILAEDGRKMSKRWGNVVNPDDIIAEFGADSIRLYEMFMGPFSQTVAWSTVGVKGSKRFAEKVWRIFDEKELIDCGNGCEGVAKELPVMLHKTIKKVTQDIESFNFNTAISQMMIFINEFSKHDKLPKAAMEKFLILLAPFAPHMAEEIWSNLGHEKSIFLEKWPEFKEELTKDEEVEMVVQVNGKIRDRIKVSTDIPEEEAKKIALESEKVKLYTDGKELKKVIYVKGKLVSIVIG